MRSKHILAIGAHPGDMEISCGAVLAAHRDKGNKVTIVHLTNSIEYNYTQHKKYNIHQSQYEAEEAAETIYAEYIIGPFLPNKLQYNEKSTSYIIKLIQKINPTSIITHWKNSIIQDHITAHKIVCAALASDEIKTISNNMINHNENNLYFAENWEDKQDFEPRIYIDISEYIDIWKKMVNCYQKYKNETTTDTSYYNYYKALAKIRGAESQFPYACAFNLSFKTKKHDLDFLP